MPVNWSAVLLLHLVTATFVLSTAGGLQSPRDRDRPTRPRRGSNGGCRIREYLEHQVEVPGCRPQVIPVRGCFGQCQTYEVPMLLPPHKVSHHKMCSYEEVEWQNVELVGCEPGVNRTYSYFNALRCRCRRCDPTDTYCAGI
ncbi:glycoprotein hormone beta-5-like [Acanthaster planci]|uniref:Glycoprotein hormone beta-5-like n=1 Tax=Acanthaster planci TaxID=133434 RepID=A0A8B7Y365_ACAPL|nr:glycoprotein hormone beta-5-like [Acanthaster planci]